MAVVSFWSNTKKETGKTSTMAAIATFMGIEHNYRILVISTSYKDNTLYNCFWEPEKIKKNLGLFGPNTNVAMQSGIEGLNRFIRSNKIAPETIRDYTRIVFKDRLDVLLGFDGEEEYVQQIQEGYPGIIDAANKYYDLVFVDVDKNLSKEIQDQILKISDIVMATMSQRFSEIDNFNKLKEENDMFKSPKTLLMIGRYDKFSKYTSKNITRYLREKNEVSTLPYNTLFFEACQEAQVADLFLKFRKIKDETDRNGFFMKEVRRLSENIIYRLQDLRMRMR